MDVVDEVLDGPRPLPIVSAGDPVLRRKASALEGQLDDDRLQRLVQAMRVTMHEITGAVGLAAPQVGIPLRLAVLETPPELATRLAERGEQPVPFTVLINASYKPVGTRRTAFFEGCLSVPGWQAVVARTDRIALTCEDEAGRRIEAEHEGVAARIMQHEIDHLDGTLYLDRAEIRSLSSMEEIIQRWMPAGLEAAARELGFSLPKADGAGQ
ncbi:peptide deformylase [Streptomyces sp. NPDC048637]|uniref:peptide deformylase n=1 Tax=Streptomyces sp. NPDC048637 TaxID=3155636 RepID=UPI00342A4655